jgi:hypothetical protein
LVHQSALDMLYKKDIELWQVEQIHLDLEDEYPITIQGY